MTTKIIKLNLVLWLLLMLQSSFAQITSAKITYERKTNLYKKLKRHNVENWMKEEDKIKSEFFELYVTDTASIFKPQDSELRELFTWATAKNTTYQNFNTQMRYMVKFIWQEELHLTDSLFKRKWQITESSRKIAGYNCRKAIWKANDSTRIYAWFSYDILPSSGPESFNGLPGTILGLATEDGGVVYFAKKVEVIKVEPVEFSIKKKKKLYTVTELKEQLTKQYSKEKWFKEVMNDEFGIW